MDSEHYYLYQIIIGTLSILCAYLTLFLKIKGKFVIVAHRRNYENKAADNGSKEDKTADNGSNEDKAADNDSKKDIKPILFFGPFSIFKRSSLKDVKKSAKFIADKLDKEFYPTLIFGIGRGGSIFGALISYNLSNVPFLFLDRLYDWETPERGVNVIFDFAIPDIYLDRVLIVAGETHTGQTMIFLRKYLKERLNAKDIRTCSYYKESTGNCKIDYVCVEGDGTSLMPWQDSNFIRDSLNRKEGERKKQQYLLHNK